MAELKTFVEKWENELTCFFCQKIFTDPKTLSCLHSFCTQCIAQFYARSGDDADKKIDCPICKTTIDVPDGDPSKLRSSFYLNSLLQLLHAIKNKAKQAGLPDCVSCEETKVLVAFCAQCDGLICEDCVKIHKRIKQFRKHQLKKLSDYDKENVISCIDNEMKDKTRFPVENELEYFCKDETCGQCKKYAVLHQKNQRMRDLEENIHGIKNLKETHENQLEESMKKMERIRQEIELAKDEVRRTEEMICKKVREQTKALICTLDRTHKEQRTATDNQQREIEREIKELSEHLQQLKALKNRGLSYHREENEKRLQENSQRLLETPSIAVQIQRKVKVHCVTYQHIERSLEHMVKIVTSFGEYGTGEGQFNFAKSVAAFDNGEIAIADSNNHRVQILSLDGKFLRKFGIKGKGEGELLNPFGVVINEDRIIVSDEPEALDGKGRIQELDLNGSYVKTIYKPEQWFVPRGMCVDDDKNIAVCCYGNEELAIKPSIKVFSQQEGLVHQFDVPGDKNKEPWYITYGNGKYFVSFCDESYVYVFDKNGIFLRKFGGRGTKEGQFLAVGGLAVYGPDMIFVCDVDNERLQLLTQEGQFLRSFGSPDRSVDQKGYPLDLAVTTDGRVVVLERFSSRVQIWC